jgi:hypothetical protein
MSTASEVLKHLGRTFALVAAIAVLIGLAVLLLFLLLPAKLGAILVLPVVATLIFLTIGWSSRWSARSTPISERIDQLSWKDENGASFVSVVERARLQPATFGGASSMRIDVLRVSVYGNESRSKPLRRTLIGDAETYLGRHGDGFWFFIDRQFYARRNGLVCIDPRTLHTRFHRPKKLGTLIERASKPSAVVELMQAGTRVEIDLRDPTGSAR